MMAIESHCQVKIIQTEVYLIDARKLGQSIDEMKTFDRLDQGDDQSSLADDFSESSDLAKLLEVRQHEHLDSADQDPFDLPFRATVERVTAREQRRSHELRSHVGERFDGMF